MACNRNLIKAKALKNDEFYTCLSDIEKELFHYKEHFKDKVIFCNCNDTENSAFWIYFHKKFKELGLKKLIATTYNKNGNLIKSLAKQAYKLVYDGTNGSVGGGGEYDNDILVCNKTLLKQNGDFRSEECIKILQEADIVVTNPPFSLFREYVAQLTEYKKKFIIIGNKNAITYREIFQLLKKQAIWPGIRNFAGGMWFSVSEKFRADILSKKVKMTHKIISDGKSDDEKLLVNCAAIFFTNLDHAKLHEKLDLVSKYNSENYPKYDNYDAINVDKTLDIPKDYYGIMGVPISFLDKYCPEQFAIVGCTAVYGVPEGWNKDTNMNPVVNGKCKYKRLLIRQLRKHSETTA